MIMSIILSGLLGLAIGVGVSLGMKWAPFGK